MATTLTSPPRQDLLAFVKTWPILTVGLLAVGIPTFVRLAQQSWSTEAGVHGPIVLATAGWLIWRRWDELRASSEPGSLPITLAVMVLAAILYGFGRAFDFLFIEAGALLLALLAIAYAFVGARTLRSFWFPILYLGFVVPLPGWALDAATQPLKMFVSEVVTNSLAALGFPITRIGVVLYVAQYQLLVEDACAGLNSIISLTAIGLFYIYVLYNASWRYALLLLALVLPVAILANVVRVVGLVLITYYFGDAAAQGYLHNFAGIVTFTAALLIIMAFDGLLTPLRRRLGAES